MGLKGGTLRLPGMPQLMAHQLLPHGDPLEPRMSSKRWRWQESSRQGGSKEGEHLRRILRVDKLNYTIYHTKHLLGLLLWLELLQVQPAK